MSFGETTDLAPSLVRREVGDAGAPLPSVAKVLHVITALSMGGAEMMIYRLLARCDRVRLSPTVLSLLTPGAIGARIRAIDVPLLTLGMRQERPLAPALRRFLLQGWMHRVVECFEVIVGQYQRLHESCCDLDRMPARV